VSKRLIRNNEPNIKDFPSVDKDREALVLIPGINEVDEEQIAWIEGQNNSVWQYYFETGTLEYIELEKETGEKTSEISFDDLGELRAKDAIKLVEGTHNLNALQAWQMKETRKGVGEAIMDKIAKLKPKKKD
jgi:hypothetical protein